MTIMESKDTTKWTFTNVCDKDGWIHSIEFTDGKNTMQLPLNNVKSLVGMLNVSYINSTERCQECSGSGRVDIGDPSQYMDEHYVDCKICNGKGRIRKNVAPRIRCIHENFKSPNGGEWCMAHCANPKSPLNGKVCDDYLRRDCQVKNL